MRLHLSKSKLIVSMAAQVIFMDCQLFLLPSFENKQTNTIAKSTKPTKAMNYNYDEYKKQRNKTHKSVTGYTMR
jgi:hypothetical protein